jgi:hypothetical protein
VVDTELTYPREQVKRLEIALLELKEVSLDRRELWLQCVLGTLCGKVAWSPFPPHIASNIGSVLLSVLKEGDLNNLRFSALSAFLLQTQIILRPSPFPSTLNVSISDSSLSFVPL